MRAKAGLVSCLCYIWHFADEIGRKIDEINGKRRVWLSLIKALDDKAQISPFLTNNSPRMFLTEIPR